MAFGWSNENVIFNLLTGCSSKRLISFFQKFCNIITDTAVRKSVRYNVYFWSKKYIAFFIFV